MALFNKKHLRLSLSNKARGIVYRCYAFYKKRIAKKLPSYDMEVVTIIQQLPNDAVCVDVGVNEAQLFNVMVKHCREGFVYGFEPIPGLYKYLEKFTSKTVKVYPYALSDAAEEVSFYAFKRTGVSGLSKRQDFLGNIEGETIRTHTVVFDELLSLQRIDLVKIDVEGAELKVLKGAKQHIIKCRPVIVFECQHSGLDYFDATPEAVFDFFEELGYSVSLTKYFLQQLPPLSRATLLNLVEHRYEYQFVAWPKQKTVGETLP